MNYNILNTDINKTIESGGNILLKSLKEIGVKETLLVLLVLFVLLIIGYIVIKTLDYFLHYKENKNKKEVESKKLSIQSRMLEQIEKDNEMLSENGAVLKLVAEKMHISISKKKYRILLRCFIGIDRAYLVRVKQKLFDFFESDQGKDKFVNMYEEILPLYYEIVLTKIHEFIFDNYKSYEILREKSRKEIIKFLNHIKNYIDDDDIGEAEKFITTELTGLGEKLIEYLINYYNQIIDDKNDIGYIGKG